MMTLQSAQTNIYKAIEQQDFSMLAESGNGTLEALRVFLATEILIEPGYTIAQYFVPKYNAHTRKFDSAAAAAATADRRTAPGAAMFHVKQA